jgi:outer membrane protein assembly factor BamE (lipoprotein component of BamABCDE complex)
VLPRRAPLAVCALAASLALSGCGTTTVVKVQESTTITKGQELTDLVRALDEGAITQREYDWLRDRILRRPY